MEVVIELPDRTAPGYLRRMRQALEFQEVFSNGSVKPTHVDSFIEFLLDYVKEPNDKDEARDALWEASQQQYEDILLAISGQADPLSPGTVTK